MSEQQLQPNELDVLQRMRREEAKTYRQIGEAIGITERQAHRILTIQDYQLSDVILLKVRRGIRSLQESGDLPVAAGQ